MVWSHSDRMNGQSRGMFLKTNLSKRGFTSIAPGVVTPMKTSGKPANSPKEVIHHPDNGIPVANNNTPVSLADAFEYSSDGSAYQLAQYGYGKNNVKVMHVTRDGPKHTIREYEVDTHLRLNSQKDYLTGDNKDIIATDTQKNTVYILAKKYGVESPEEFALLLCNHFLYTYRHVDEVSVHVMEYPWERLQADGTSHNHAFIFCPSGFRFSKVTQKRNERPVIVGGLSGMRVLKTTQSAFTDFVQDEYRTLPDAYDRVFSTEVTATWEYSTANGVNFNQVWDMVKECILDKFAGPPEEGIFSPSVQNTLYLAEKMILDKVYQIKEIEMRMPNKHYLPLDLKKFPKNLIKGDSNKEVYQPIDKPSGHIHATLKRKEIQAKL